MKQIPISKDEISSLEAMKIYISNEILNLEIEEDSEKEKVFLKMESTIDSIIKNTTVQRNYPIGSVDLNRNHSSDVLV